MGNATRPYGVLGRTLGHSYTPVIYRELAGIDYVRFEREPEQVEAFLHGDEWEGVNVTIPYKKTVVPYLDELSDVARRMGNVNTITRLADGRLRGDNTDYFGFKFLVESTGVDLEGACVLVLGGDGEPSYTSGFDDFLRLERSAEAEAGAKSAKPEKPAPLSVKRESAPPKESGDEFLPHTGISGGGEAMKEVKARLSELMREKSAAAPAPEEEELPPEEELQRLFKKYF